MDVSKFDLSDYGISLNQSDKLSYCNKLSELTLNQCPFKTPQLYWTKTKVELKSLVKHTTRNDLFAYFAFRQIHVQGESIGNVKSMESHMKFVDGYLCIENIKWNGYCQRNGLVCIMILYRHTKVTYLLPF